MGINFSKSNVSFGAAQTPAPKAEVAKQEPPKPIPDDNKILPNNLRTKIMRSFQKTTSAFTEYPAKGLTGDKKSTFYEFLTMGTVPYLLGSATFISIFNGVNKFLPAFGSKIAKSKGYKMALGVAFYGIAKSLSKSLVTTPVKMATGIDTEMPYEKVSYSLPTSNDDGLLHQYEQHGIFESRDFPRFDLLYGDKENKSHNYRYDKIAKKCGLGENLQASDTEVKPIIKDVISRTSTAKSLSSYLWAAVGVALAVQKPWDNFFNATSKKCWKPFIKNDNDNKIINFVDKSKNTGLNILRITKSFGRNFLNAAKDLYKGPEASTGFAKHAGKALLATAVITTVLGVANAIHGSRIAGDRDRHVINKNKKVTVE